jgi:hypothetical protein
VTFHVVGSLLKPDKQLHGVECVVIVKMTQCGCEYATYARYCLILDNVSFHDVHMLFVYVFVFATLHSAGRY